MKNSFTQENLKSLFSNSSPHLLQQYFHNKNLLKNINFEEEKNQRKKRGFTSFLIEEIEKIIADSERGKIKADLNKIYLMREKQAIQNFLRDGSLKEETIHKAKEENNNLDKALVLFLEDQANFEDFYLVYDVVNYGKKWWNTRNDYVDEDQEITEEIKNNLVNEAKKYLEAKNQDGKFCDRTISIGDNEYIFAFYEDLAQEQYQIKDGELNTIFSNPVNKVVFLYNKTKKFIKIYGADKHIKEKMHQVAAKIIFNKDEIPQEQEKNEIYDLMRVYDDLINNQSISFKINPNSAIKRIIPISINLLKPSNGTLEIKSGKMNGEYSNLFDSLRQHIAVDEISKNEVSFDEVEPLWISFIALYQDNFDKNRISSKEFKITNRNNVCNIGEEDIDFEILDCLQDSGIMKIKADQEPVNSNDKPEDSKYNQAI
jgi:hypothetical protein